VYSKANLEGKDAAFKNSQKDIALFWTNMQISEPDFSLQYYIFKLVQYSQFFPILRDVFSNEESTFLVY